MKLHWYWELDMVKRFPVTYFRFVRNPVTGSIYGTVNLSPNGFNVLRVDFDANETPQEREDCMKAMLDICMIKQAEVNQ